jgi:predicted O-linked N-acetylglucosamine transferase (SPINDLY family)
LHQQGQLALAEQAYEGVLRLQPGNADGLHMLGVIAAQQHRFERAAELLQRAQRASPGDPRILSNLGGAYRELRQFGAAMACFAEAVRLAPEFAQAHANLGSLLSDAHRHEEALAAFDRVVSLAPREPIGYRGRATSLKSLHRLDEALTALDLAVSLEPKDPSLLADRGCLHLEMHNPSAALADFGRALALEPRHFMALCNRGLALVELGQFEESVASYRRALALDPDDGIVHNNMGIALAQLGQYSEAVKSFDRALAVRSDHATWHNRAFSLRQLGRFDESLQSLERAYELAPTASDVLGDLVRARQTLCDWSHWDNDISQLRELAMRAEAVVHPFGLLAAIDAPEAHRAAATAWAAKRFPRFAGLGSVPASTSGGRIRVAYVSGDFREHPVAYLMAEVFERHDRRRFDLVALSSGPDDGSAMRRRIERAFDRFIDIRDRNDRDTARLARELGIDIAIDLSGFTTGSRLGLFACRAAPVQVTYLGYLGTLGTDYMDYMIADEVIVPDGSRDGYAEKIVRLPCYQPNDTRRQISERPITRAELGLPASGFVFCCMNASHKFTPTVFDLWMRILADTPGSVLQLYSQTERMQANLRREAQARGVAPERLVFCGKLPRDEYLARYRVADLFLDTSPYNAGTTASDALWAGLPVLTCPGRSFASRMGASLLRSAGLPELIAGSADDYVRIAVELATRPDRLVQVRDRLAAERGRCRLFDVVRFTASLETAFEAMHERILAGLAPDHLDIPAS